MNTFIPAIILIGIFTSSAAQTWQNNNSTTTSDWNTSIQLTYTGWGAQHGILFNAYRSNPLVDGPLVTTGNTKYTFGQGVGYGNGAGAIMFLANGGRMDFLVSPASVNAGDNVNWGLPKMSIGREGKVGIGTDNPSSLFSVVGDYGINIEPAYSTAINYYLSSNSADNIIGVNARTKVGTWEIPDPSKPSSFINFSTYNVNNPYYGGISFHTRAANVQGLGSNTEKMTILNNGNVGIGTVNPAVKLEVNGTTNIGSDLGTVIGPGTQLNFLGASSNSDPLWMARYNNGQNSSELRVFIGDDNFGDDAFTVGNALYGHENDWRTLLKVQNNGRVGIGTALPDATLTVNGDVHTKEVRVDVTGPLSGPDYVFEKDYALLPLAELEAYIGKNKHLPDVPSAKEMEANGLNLKEMNLLLLKKVEELTLHVIELNNKVAAYHAENEQLKKEREHTKH